MARQFKVHPAVGVARLGTSDEFYLASGTPGVPSNLGSSYRDTTPAKKRKAQAAGFWVFLHDSELSGEPILIGPGSVIGNKTVERIEWTVHLANKKAFWFKFDGLTGSKNVTNPPNYGYPAASLRNPAPAAPTERRKKWIIDFGPRTVAAPGGTARFDAASAGTYPVAGPGTVVNAAGSVAIDSLGSVRGRADGGLLVIPAPGVSGSVDGSGIGDFANNPGWFDNTSDGSVRAEIVFTDGSKQPVDLPAWVIVAPPDAAPAVTNMVTLYDVMFDVSVRFFGSRPDIYAGPAPSGVDDFKSTSPPFQSQFQPSFLRDVFPILRRAGDYAWVHSPAAGTHDAWDMDALAAKPYVPNSNSVSPADIFARLRRPEAWNTQVGQPFMPILLGDDDSASRLTLTPTQYHIMRQWSLGHFDTTAWTSPPPVATPDATPKAHNLDRAALEECSGGAFYPGIEIGWLVREPKVYVSPFQFRFKVAPLGAGGPLGLDTGAVPDAMYPGDVTKRMACPWQADFWKCQGMWWPAQRPDQVVVNAATGARGEWHQGVKVLGGQNLTGHMGMVVNWDRLGVVVPATVAGAPGQAQSERTL